MIADEKHQVSFRNDLPCENKPLSNYLWEDPPDETKWADCVHCGMCLEACPTYLETGHEHQSPRGRVYLIKAVAEGKITINEQFLDPVFTCLDCRACETACPSGVQVGGLIEEARGQIRQAIPLTGWEKSVNHLFLKTIFPNPSHLDRLGSLVKFYQKSGLQSVARKIGLLNILPKHLKEMESVLPEVKQSVRKKYRNPISPVSKKKQQVALLTGCIMDVVFSDVHEATINILTENGYEVVIPQDQKCCGALHVHAGEREEGKKLAKANIAAFQDFTNVIVNAAGCGCAMKEYPELFRNDLANRKQAEQFAAKVVDVTKFLVENGYRKPTANLQMKVTYHDACHLAHGQNVRTEPRQILADIPGIEVIEMANADQCCGSAGIYNLTNPEMAEAVLKEKMTALPNNVEVISMGNPGCMLQMAVGVEKYGQNQKIFHTVQLLDLAYKKEMEVKTE